MSPQVFVDVLLPLPLPGYFSYKIPGEITDEVKPGMRVVVQFGAKKVYTALVRRIHDKPPHHNEIKEILSVLDSNPIVNEKQFAFWEWMASYYMCTPGEVMNAALPSGLKLQSETRIEIHPDYIEGTIMLNEREFVIVETLMNSGSLSLDEVAILVDNIKVHRLVSNLIEKRIVWPTEEIREKFKPKVELYVRLNPKLKDKEDDLRQIMDDLGKRAFKQLELLMTLIHLTQQKKLEYIRKTDLLKSHGFSSTVLNMLEEKNIVEVSEKIISRLGTGSATHSSDSINLIAEQENAMESIKAGFEKSNVVLFHGVTSSGKTEIYIKLIQDIINSGKQALFLLPEIALTAQVIIRLKKYFGDNVGIYHSKYNEAERVEIWNNVLIEKSKYSSEQGKYKVILGARSALLLPYSALGLIVVDEEHDNSYKQVDPAPRYHARDSAIYLAHLHGAKTLLGSATPSIESYHAAKSGKYGFAELMVRYSGVQLPEIQVADMKKETRQKTVKNHFSSLLIENVKSALRQKEQVILFQNRRGHSVRLQCFSCDWIPMCKNCDVNLVFYKQLDRLKCHYCGLIQKLPEKCPQCHSKNLNLKGFGTEKIEDELPEFFPDAKIARMDFDTTRSKIGHGKIINEFEERRIDILIGTQMVTKGLDFNNVSVVGILDADSLISHPDFRSFERSFQLIAQVSGRAGRDKKRGKVIIQTWQPYHSVIRYAMENDYQSMYQSQIYERMTFRYPPFFRLIRITLKHKEIEIIKPASVYFGNLLKEKLGYRVLGPEAPVVSRIQNYYLRDLLIKIEKEISLLSVKEFIQHQIEEFSARKEYRAVRVIIDVDPVY